MNVIPNGLYEDSVILSENWIIKSYALFHICNNLVRMFALIGTTNNVMWFDDISHCKCSIPKQVKLAFLLEYGL
mgnify:CR=1 FL=1